VERPQPGVVVHAYYPGADAQTVAETVAAPIEQQINGVEKMLSMRSQCGDDGSYTLAVTFDDAVDLSQAQALTQNRVSLALPLLPDEVRRRGVTVRKRSSGVLLICCLSSPDSSYDSVFLSNYATIQLRDELVRLPGVGDLTMLGTGDYAMRLLLDPDSMAARHLTASDVVRAIEAQDVQTTGGWVTEAGTGKSSRTPVFGQTLGRLAGPEQIEDIILKTDAEGHTIRLKDVARVELGGGERQIEAFRGSKPVVVLAVHLLWEARVREVEVAVQDAVSRLRAALPKGLALDIPFDFAANLGAPNRPAKPEYLLLDLTLPTGASAERASSVLRRCESLVRGVGGVQDALALPSNPFDLFRNTPCILVQLKPLDKKPDSRDRIIEAVRNRLAQIEGVAVGLRDLSGPSRMPDCGYPVDLAVFGPDETKVKDWTGRIARRLHESSQLIDVWSGLGTHPRIYVDIDRTAMNKFGVASADVFGTLRVYLGSQQPGTFTQFGRTWQVLLQADARGGEKMDDIKRLKVRNAKGDMVPISGLVTVRTSEAAAILDRLNLYPAVEITANPAPGKPLSQVRAQCETVAEEARKEFGLPEDYRMSWLPGSVKPAQPAVTRVVAVSQPLVREVSDYEIFTGRTEASQSVEIRARVTGYLDNILFKPGAIVRRGDMLFEIDARAYQADLARCDAEVQSAQVRLKQLTAQLDRAKMLQRRQAVGQDEVERMAADHAEAEANLAARRANLEISRLNLAYTKLTSPIDGRISRPLIDAGNLVVADTTSLATVIATDPMFVSFDVDERTVLRLRSAKPEGRVKPDGRAEISVSCGLADDAGFSRQGKLDSTDIRVDPATGTLRFRAVLPNTDGILLPGMSVRVRLTTSAPHKALLVPDSSLAFDHGQSYVLVLTTHNVLQRRDVKTGPLHDGMRSVPEGLTAEDWVITDGLQRVRPGMTVKPARAAMPGARSTP